MERGSSRKKSKSGLVAIAIFLFILRAPAACSLNSWKVHRMATKFDAIVVGAGQAGPPLANRLANSGMKVAFVERKLFGGTCVNTGCTPTKAMVASAYAAQLARRGSDYGVNIPSQVSVDMRKVKARKDEIVHNSSSGVENWLRGNKNITVLTGTASFVAQ